MKYSETVRQNEEGLHALNMKWSPRYTLKGKKMQAEEQCIKRGLKEKKKNTPSPHTHISCICIKCLWNNTEETDSNWAAIKWLVKGVNRDFFP